MANCSRVFVKDLPMEITDEMIRTHFSECGTITDIRLLHRKDGGFRRLAVIGFKQVDDAERAIKRNNRSFIRNSRITVLQYYLDQLFASGDRIAEVDNGESARPRPWSKYSEGSSAFVRRQQASSTYDVPKKIEKKNPSANKSNGIVDNLLSDLRGDADFERFISEQDPSLLDHMLPSSNPSNSSMLKGQTTQTNITKQMNIAKQTKPRSVTTPYKLRVEGIPFKFTEKNSRCVDRRQSKSIARPRIIRILHDHATRAPKGIALVWFKTEDELSKVMELHKTKVGKRYISLFPIIQSTTPDTLAHEAVEDPAGPDSLNPIEKADLPEISETVICKNIWYECSEEELTDLMKPFGSVDSIQIPICKSTQKSKGYAVVTFADVASAIKAINALDATIFQGRLVRVEPHRNAEDSLTVGQQNKQCLWNSLFVTPNIIADRLAKRYGFDRREIYDQMSNGGSLPVRLAAAEADIVEKTKAFLIANGVQLNLLENQKCARSKRILLVKNVDFDDLALLRSRLEQYGSIKRWVFPPEGTGGIVEFARAEDAATVLQCKQEYFKPVMFEPAPTKILKGEKDAPAAVSPLESVDDQRCVVYVKGLDFSTTNEVLQAHFGSIGPCVAQIAYNNAKGKKLSMGYGFLSFKRKEHAHEAIKTMQNCSLDGHKLELALSRQRPKKTNEFVYKRPSNQAEDENATKICVRNIPFQVTEKEVEELFTVFGQLRSVRLPKKVDGGHRGFGFVDFTSRKSAKTAFDSLSSSTHMFGRRLVLEWADDDADVLDLHRKRARNSEAVSTSQKKVTQSEIVRSLKDQHSSDGNDD